MHNMVKDKTLRLASIQNRIQEMGPDNDFLKQEKDAQLDLEVALNKEEAFWLEKSRVILFQTCFFVLQRKFFV